MRSLQDGVFWMSGSRERRYFARKSCVATVLSFCEYFARSFANKKKTRKPRRTGQPNALASEPCVMLIYTCRWTSCDAKAHRLSHLVTFTVLFSASPCSRTSQIERRKVAIHRDTKGTALARRLPYLCLNSGGSGGFRFCGHPRLKSSLITQPRRPSVMMRHVGIAARGDDEVKHDSEQ